MKTTWSARRVAGASGWLLRPCAPRVQSEPKEFPSRGPGLDRPYPTLSNLPQERRRGNGLAQMLSEETDQPSTGRQAGQIAVQVQSVDALNFQGNVTLEQFVNVGHDP